MKTTDAKTPNRPLPPPAGAKGVRRYRERDQRRNRKRVPPPTEGFLIEELALLSGFAGVTIKGYIRRGLLARVKFYGNATRYSRSHLLRLLVIRFLRFGSTHKLDEVRRRLDQMSEADMERWIVTFPIHATVLTALGLKPTPKADADAVQTQTTSALVTALPNEAWRKVVLMPGLELQLRSDAPPMTVNMAERLLNAFAGFIETKPSS